MYNTCVYCLKPKYKLSQLNTNFKRSAHQKMQMPLNILTKKNYGLLGKEKGKLSFIMEKPIVLYQKN